MRIAPSAATIRRVLERVCPGGLADLAGGDPAGATTVAVDGKSARGSRNGHVPSAHLLAAMTGDGQTISQLRVPDKTNEITGFARLLAPFDLTGIVVTADALHTQREHVRFLTRDKQAHYLLVVKNNQPSLFTALRSLPWSRVTARHAAHSRGHGRRELRVVKALTVDGLELDFPGAVQAARIMRFRANAGTGRLTRKTIYAITDLPSTQASQQLGELARSHWGIENRLHFVRDTTSAEDASRIRTGRGPGPSRLVRLLRPSPPLRDARFDTTGVSWVACSLGCWFRRGATSDTGRRVTYADGIPHYASTGLHRPQRGRAPRGRDAARYGSGRDCSCSRCTGEGEPRVPGPGDPQRGHDAFGAHHGCAA
ncbi:hypothetical protein GCM10020000_83120 [Streptomyces olivoverticillatus]